MALKKKAYISTGAFHENELISILEICRQKQFRGVELSSGLPFTKEFYSILHEYRRDCRMDFLIHNYFPAPQIPFVLNLSSNNKDVLHKSREHCMQAIGMCNELDIPFYSVHCGFCFHARPEDLGKKQVYLARIPFKTAEDIFTESIMILAEEAERCGLGLAIENNVAIPDNIVDSQNELLLGVTSEDLLGLLEKIGKENVSILLDLAHLKISSNSLGFSLDLCVKDVSSHVKAVHLSDNDGYSDTHQPLNDASGNILDFLRMLSECEAYVLEVYQLSADEITSQFNLLMDMLAEMDNK